MNDENKNQKDSDIVFKLVLIGDSGVGKSCIMHNFIYKKFKKDSKFTIGVEFGTKTVQLGDKEIKLQIWDTAGQDKFRAVARSYYRGAIGVIIAYDITKQESFNHVDFWLNEVKNTAKNESCVIVVGNKKDLVENRVIKYNDAASYCQQNNLSHFECSALTGENIEELFNVLCKQIITKIDLGIIDPSAVTSNLNIFIKSPSTNINLEDYSSSAKSKNCQC